MDSITKSDIDKTFGKILKQYRKKNKLTQEQLAEKLEISIKYVSRIENGTSGIKTQTLIKYMNILGIAPNIIFSSFITNPNLKSQIELSNKLSHLSNENTDLLSAIADLLEKY